MYKPQKYAALSMIVTMFLHGIGQIHRTNITQNISIKPLSARFFFLPATKIFPHLFKTPTSPEQIKYKGIKVQITLFDLLI